MHCLFFPYCHSVVARINNSIFELIASNTTEFSFFFTYSLSKSRKKKKKKIKILFTKRIFVGYYLLYRSTLPGGTLTLNKLNQ